MAKGSAMGEQESGYNGWPNYETWAMALWIDNDQGSYGAARELVEAACAQADDRDFRAPEGLVADALKAWQEEAMFAWESGEGLWCDGERPASVFTDLLHAAFSEVDWYEIAVNYLNEFADA